MSTIIEVRNVSKSYGGVVANEDISMSVAQGGITGLIGPNGSGKTTLFNSIVGYHPIDSGSIKFEDREISKLPVQKIARLGLLRTFQQTRIYGAMNCVENMLISLPHRKMSFHRFVRPQQQTRLRTGGPVSGIRRPLRKAFPALRFAVLRSAETAGVCHGADE